VHTIGCATGARSSSRRARQGDRDPQRVAKTFDFAKLERGWYHCGGEKRYHVTTFGGARLNGTTRGMKGSRVARLQRWAEPGRGPNMILFNT